MCWRASHCRNARCTSRALRESLAASSRACRSTGSKGPSPPASPSARSTRFSARSASCRVSAMSSAPPPFRRLRQPQRQPPRPRPRCRRLHLQWHRQSHRLHRDASDTRLAQWPEAQRERECESATAPVGRCSIILYYLILGLRSTARAHSQKSPVTPSSCFRMLCTRTTRSLTRAR